MKLSFASRILMPAALLLSLALPTHLRAQAVDQDHVVTSQALDNQVQSSAAERQKSIDTLNNVLSTPQAAQAMKEAHADPTQIKNAIPSLSDKDLASLSARAEKAQNDFSAGFISTGLFTVILLAVIVIIIIIVVH